MKKNVPTITIITAAKLSALQFKELQQLVESKVGEAEYKQVVEPSVLGGIKLMIGEQEFDATIAGKLKKLDSQLSQVSITTAVPLTSEQRKKLSTAIEKKMGSVEFKEVVDPQVLGGVKLLLESREFDATIKGKLQKLKQLLLQTV